MKLTVIILFAFLSNLAYALDNSKDSCPFCNEAISNQVVSKSNSSTIIYNYKPATKGHLLVVPNRHIVRFSELTSEEIADIKDSIINIKTAYKDLYNEDDFLILQKNGEKAGQTVAHVHFHVVPATSNANINMLRLAFYRSKISNKELFTRVDEYREYFEKSLKK